MSNSLITIGKSDAGNVELDVDRLLLSRALITASSGGGKSWLLRKILEEVSKTTQTLVIDPEGEFSSLREIRDMVLVGPDGDLPADPRTAGVLARRLIETGVSAVMDIYELTPEKKRQFVAAFCTALVDLPKALWHNCIVVIDEVHEFAPNTKDRDCVSREPVSLLFSKGRSRGLCPLVATQRLSKLSMDVAAEAKNRFIGQHTLDLDQQRAADFLGWEKKRWPDIRDLSPPGREGEWFALGPALTVRGIVKFRAGQVKTTHPEAGKAAAAPPQPSRKITAVLGELHDLAAQADEEARTLEEAKRQIGELKRQVRAAGKPATVEVASKKEQAIIHRLRKGLEDAMKTITTLTAQVQEKIAIDPAIVEQAIRTAAEQIVKAANQDLARKSAAFERLRTEAARTLGNLQRLLAVDAGAAPMPQAPAVPPPPPRAPSANSRKPADGEPSGSSADLTTPERRVLDSLAFWESIGIPTPNNTAVAFKAGYAGGSSAYRNPRGTLRKRGLITFPSGDLLQLTEEGKAAARFPDDPGDLNSLHNAIMESLDGPQRKLLQSLLASHAAVMTNADLAAAAGYAEGSSAYRNPRGQLRKFGLIEFAGGAIRATAVLFPPQLS